MSYTVELIVPPLPAADDEAWMVVKSLRTRYPGDSRVKAPALVQLHQRLVERYPCLSSFADDDPAIDDCPWADGPMLDNFSAEMGMLAISYSHVDEVLPFLVRAATELGISVVDEQTETIYRSAAATGKAGTSERAWWKFWS